MTTQQQGAAPDTVVVGAGLAGLACAMYLSRAGQRVIVLEASDGVGGRMRTDRKGGFLLDRGFQMFRRGAPRRSRRRRVRRGGGAPPAGNGRLQRIQGRVERLARCRAPRGASRRDSRARHRVRTSGHRLRRPGRRDRTAPPVAPGGDLHQAVRAVALVLESEAELVQAAPDRTSVVERRAR